MPETIRGLALKMIGSPGTIQRGCEVVDGLNFYPYPVLIS